MSWSRLVIEPDYTYAATVLRVVDADTLDLDLDLGLSTHVHQRVRLAGVDCPEKRTVAGQEALRFTAAWLAEHAPNGRVVVRTVKDQREKFGRYLAYVHTVFGGSATLNAALFAAGHAKAYMGGVRT